MAAYAALVSLMNDLDEIQNHPIHSFCFDNKQITSLSQTVDLLIDFIESHDSHGRSSEALESRIASAAHAAHDVIQSRVVDQLLAGSTLGGKPRSYFFLDLQKAIDNVKFVWRKAMHVKTKSGLLKAEQPTYLAPASTTRKTTMVGFDGVRDQLMHMLTGERPSGHRRVIPLVGMGGIGKTTLAQNAYEHLYIQHYFDVCLWATISQQYSDETILTQLLYGESRSTSRNVNTLAEELHKKLWGRRYLIVLDDIWGIDAWDMIHMFLPDNGNGSCVIVTTRLSNLADHLSSDPPFKMNFLDEYNSWELFCGEAFGQGRCPLELEKVGKKIVKRCRGLPLSIIVVGGHLKKSSKEIEYWEKFAGLMYPISSSVKDEQCLKIISLSYQHLPAHLKPCFLYLGIYNEDERIDASALLKFWVAEGFLKPKKDLSLEYVADDYLNDLIDRNLILVHKRSWNGKAEICGIHDIVRELCLKVGKNEKFMHVHEEGSGKAIVRKCRITRFPKRKHREYIGYLKLPLPVRSCVGDGWCLLDDEIMSLDFKSLRLSDFVKNCKSLTAAHFQLLNLRSLSFNLHQRSIESKGCYIIHSSISLFWNVKILIIRNHWDFIVSLPYEIWEMPQLRHLEFNSVCLPDPLPSENSNEDECIVLQNLHTLIGVEDFKLTEEVCRRMPTIKNLSLSYTHDLPCDFDAILYYCPHNLGRFTNLELLTCNFYGEYSNWRKIVLSFTFPSTLKELCLGRCQLDWEDLTMMITSLPHLEALDLFGVKGTEFNLVEEEFPCLKTLKISYCEDLIYWNANSFHFPALEILNVEYVSELREIPFDIGEIPTLQRIIVDKCSISAAFSAVRIVVEQESLGNEDLQLDVHFQKMDEVKSFKKMVQEQGLRSKSLRLYHGLTFMNL